LAKKKLSRFNELKSHPRVLQPDFHQVFQKNFSLKGKWGEVFFNNSNPIVLELGCGKGEYTTELAKYFPGRNFIGIDIKGARIWKGAKQVAEEKISNAGFLRTRIDLSESFFARNEVSEIWITFPDPQPKKARKRLTSPLFLNRYRNFLQPKGVIHLKTDSRELFDYTLETLQYNACEVLMHTADIYGIPLIEEFLSIKTFYERQFLAQGKPITYIRFRLIEKEIIDIPSYA